MTQKYNTHRKARKNQTKPDSHHSSQEIPISKTGRRGSRKLLYFRRENAIFNYTVCPKAHAELFKLQSFPAFLKFTAINRVGYGSVSDKRSPQHHPKQRPSEPRVAYKIRSTRIGIRRSGDLRIFLRTHGFVQRSLSNSSDLHYDNCQTVTTF
jgi:hypothetical protein